MSILAYTDETYQHGHHPAVVADHAKRTADAVAAFFLPFIKPGMRLLDVGCGLGDNAVALAAKGFRTTGFDLSARAIHWAQSRFPDVTFFAADVFKPPADWSDAFDFVHECYTLQALPDAPRREAIGNLARFVRPGGSLLLIARARDTSGPASGPPWPMTRDEVMSFARHGLIAETLDQLADPTDGKPHWRALFRRG